MKDKIQVSKIEIEVAGQILKLKPEQAKELKRILNDMFEEHVEHHWHRYWWNYPTYTYPCNPYPQWTITCGGQSGTLTGAGGNVSTTDSTVYLNAA